MNWFFTLILTAVFFLFPARYGAACDYCMLSQGISPLDTMKGTGIKVSERYTLLDNVYRGTTELTNPGSKEEHWTTEVTGFYALTPRFMLLAVIPYKKASTTGDPAVNPDGSVAGLDVAGAGDSSGLGDGTLMARYSFYKEENPDTTTIMAAIAGIKFPSGKTDARTSSGADFLDSHLQPGTGSTDYLFGFSYSHSLERFSLSANLLGTITTEGKVGNTKHEFGNSVNYDVTGKYRIVPWGFAPMKPQVFAAFGVNGEVREREKEDGVTVPDSGGSTFYLTPGLQFVLPPHWIIEATYQRAVYHNLYGTQAGETYKAVTGVTYLF